MRTINIALVSLALLLGGYVWTKWQPCSTVRECYWSWKALANDADPMEGRQLHSIYGGFTASAQLAAFRVPVSPAADGILLFDRSTRRAAIIAPEGYSHWSPRFSDDGERLVFVRSHAGHSVQELVSCTVSHWRCTSLLASTGSISSPVDIGAGKVLLALGYPAVRDGKVTRYKRYDFHMVRAGRQPARMTEFDLFGLQAISVNKDKVYFQAMGGKSDSRIEPCTSVVKCNSSEIFSLDLDRERDRMFNLPDRLKPAIMVDGISLAPAISADGTRLAFLNTSREHAIFRYNLKVSDTNGHLVKAIGVNGIAFSTAAFVGETLLINELFKDRYRISIFDRDLNRIDSIEIDNSPEFLVRLPRIELVFDSERRGA